MKRICCFLIVPLFFSMPLFAGSLVGGAERMREPALSLVGKDSGIVYRPVGAVVTDRVNDQFVPADIGGQVIRGWLGERMRANGEKRLLQVDEEAILAGYKKRPGSHPWIGEHAGKFLDAGCYSYLNTHDPALKARLDRVALQLIAAQLPDGYLGTYTPENYWTSWDVWSHKYNIIGLLHYYSLSGYTPALEAARKAADLLCRTFGYDPGQRDLIKAGEHVGMAATSVLEPMVDLYRFTGEKRYLDFCFYIIKAYDQPNGPKIISTLVSTGRVDKTANAKAYEMLSNLVGIIKLYKVTGDGSFLRPVLLAWEDIVRNRLYVTGTASSFERFKGDGVLPASPADDMGEGCVTTTWIQLNYQLLCLTGEGKYTDELERSVYNHLMGAENPSSGCVSYYTPLVGVKPYRCVITCCMSSVPRAISMIPLFANGKIGGRPAFLLYQPGSYSTSVNDAGGCAVKVRFETETNFPMDGEVSVSVTVGRPLAFSVEFRKPYWAEGYALSVNGVPVATEGGGAVMLNRVWKSGDRVAVHFTMPVRVLDGGISYPGCVALQRGPQVLAVDERIGDFDSAENLLRKGDLVMGDSGTGVLRAGSGVRLRLVGVALPRGWVGKEVFEVEQPGGDGTKKVLLVPYADAGQTGAAVRTWIKTK